VSNVRSNRWLGGCIGLRHFDRSERLPRLDAADVLADVSPVSHVDECSVPTFVAWAEFENPLIDVHCAELCFRLAQAKRRAPLSMWLRGHNHTSSIAHINTAEDALGLAMLDFIAHPR
jgi:acetyl esterase